MIFGEVASPTRKDKQEEEEEEEEEESARSLSAIRLTLSSNCGASSLAAVLWGFHPRRPHITCRGDDLSVVVGQPSVMKRVAPKSKPSIANSHWRCNTLTAF